MNVMFRHIFCDNISIYDETIALNYDKISLFVVYPIDIIVWMMYACNGIKYHTFDMAVFGCPVRNAAGRGNIRWLNYGDN